MATTSNAESSSSKFWKWLAPIVAAVLVAGSQPWWWPFKAKAPETAFVPQTQVHPTTPAETAPSEAHAPTANTGSNFGAWATYAVNTAYEAKTDGFVSAYGVGSSPAPGADILTGKSPNKLDPHSRFNSAWGGVVMPVARGDYWMVRPLSGGGLAVEWMPVQSSK